MKKEKEFKNIFGKNIHINGKQVKKEETFNSKLTQEIKNLLYHRYIEEQE